MPSLLSTSDIAKAFGVPRWKIARLYELGVVAEPEHRIGGKRAISRDQLPEINAALAERGWLIGAIQFEQQPELASA